MNKPPITPWQGISSSFCPALPPRSAKNLRLSLLICLLAACTRRPGPPPGQTEPVPLSHATHLSHERGQGYSVWTMRDPWDTTRVLHRYILQHQQSATLPPSLTGSVIHVPVRRAGVATAVHCGLLDELGAAGAIAGVCEPQYIDLPAVTRGLQDGTVADFGSGMNPNVERIMDAAPDVLLLTPFEHSGGYGRVERLGIPIVECADYMESSPLARAEWVRFYAELFGAEAQADTLFRGVEQRYRALCQRARSTTERPRLLAEMLYGGQWFVPCARSTMGIMFAHARAHYLFADQPGSGSASLSFETVLDRAQDADVWLLKYNAPQPLTRARLAADYPPYTRFRPFRQRHIWGCNLARTHFYEQTPFHPDRLLRDYLIILHPQLFPGQEPTYYQRLQ